MRSVVTCCALILLLLLASSPATANLITNGGFETGNFSGWTLSGAGVPPVSGYGPYYGITTYHPRSGTYAAWFGDPNAMTYLSQTIQTVPGQEYLVSFWAANQPFYATPSNEFQVFWDGSPVFTVNDAPGINWTLTQGILTATQTSTEIKFGFENGPEYFVLDDVQIDAVPEPGATILCGAGLGLLVAFGRRLRRKA